LWLELFAHAPPVLVGLGAFLFILYALLMVEVFMFVLSYDATQFVDVDRINVEATAEGFIITGSSKDCLNNLRNNVVMSKAYKTQQEARYHLMRFASNLIPKVDSLIPQMEFPG
jgi:hypothetical protein